METKCKNKKETFELKHKVFTYRDKDNQIKNLIKS